MNEIRIISIVSKFSVCTMFSKANRKHRNSQPREEEKEEGGGTERETESEIQRQTDWQTYKATYTDADRQALR